MRYRAHSRSPVRPEPDPRDRQTGLTFRVDFERALEACSRILLQQSVDVFVSESPRMITDSKSLGDRRNDQVGVGAVKGDSATYGKNKYWVVVIYTSPK